MNERANKYYKLFNICSFNRGGVNIGREGCMFHLDYNEEQELVKELGKIFKKAWRKCKDNE